MRQRGRTTHSLAMRGDRRVSTLEIDILTAKVVWRIKNEIRMIQNDHHKRLQGGSGGDRSILAHPGLRRNPISRQKIQISLTFADTSNARQAENKNPEVEQVHLLGLQVVVKFFFFLIHDQRCHLYHSASKHFMISLHIILVEADTFESLAYFPSWHRPA